MGGSVSGERTRKDGAVSLKLYLYLLRLFLFTNSPIINQRPLAKEIDGSQSFVKPESLSIAIVVKAP